MCPQKPPIDFGLIPTSSHGILTDSTCLVYNRLIVNINDESDFKDFNAFAQKTNWPWKLSTILNECTLKIFRGHRIEKNDLLLGIQALKEKSTKFTLDYIEDRDYMDSGNDL
jgi:hypothetical protein